MHNAQYGTSTVVADPHTGSLAWLVTLLLAQLLVVSSGLCFAAVLEPGAEISGDYLSNANLFFRWPSHSEHHKSARRDVLA